MDDFFQAIVDFFNSLFGGTGPEPEPEPEEEFDIEEIDESDYSKNGIGIIAGAFNDQGKKKKKKSKGPKTQGHGAWEAGKRGQILPGTAEFTLFGGKAKSAVYEEATFEIASGKYKCYGILHPDWKKYLPDISDESKERGWWVMSFNNFFAGVASLLSTAGGEQNWDYGLFPECWPTKQYIKLYELGGKYLGKREIDFTKSGQVLTWNQKLQTGNYYKLVPSHAMWPKVLDSDLAWHDEKDWKVRYSKMALSAHWIPEIGFDSILTKEDGTTEFIFQCPIDQSWKLVELDLVFVMELAQIKKNQGVLKWIEDAGVWAAKTAIKKIKGMAQNEINYG